jgi:hypothetical protein
MKNQNFVEYLLKSCNRVKFLFFYVFDVYIGFLLNVLLDISVRLNAHNLFIPLIIGFS